MSRREFKLPDPGEGLLEAEIVEWKVAVGDTVKVNDIVVEVETAKSLVELPIPWAGTVADIHVAVGDEVEVGTVIITIEDGVGGAAPVETPGGDSAASAVDVAEPATGEAGVPDEDAAIDEEPVKTLVGYGPKASGTTRRARRGVTPQAPVAPVEPVPSPSEGAGTGPSADAGGRHTPTFLGEQAGTSVSGDATPIATAARPLAKPPVRKLAKDRGIDLTAVPATGPGGIVTRADVEAYAAAQGTSSAPDGARSAAPTAPSTRASADAPDFGASAMPQSGGQLQSGAEGLFVGGPSAREVRTPIKGVRKMTAQAMVASAFTAPHVTEWVTVDVTATMELVERLRSDREFRDVKVTPLLVLAKAMLVAIRRNPGINASWDEAAQEIVLKHYVNLGIAAATPRGLIVPNVKEAHSLTMRQLAEAIAALTATAREGRTPPADMAGGTMTITNIGVFGIDAGTPILNPGESAILAFGTIARRPWVVGTGSEERIEPRWVTTLALSFDHRLVDGELGSRFLADVAAILADPSRGLVWG